METRVLTDHLHPSFSFDSFAFLFIHGFIISTLAAGIVGAIQQIRDDPGSTVTLLATQLPTASVFFLTLVVTNGLSGAAGGLLQIGRLVVYYVKAFLLGGSPRALHKVRYTMPSVKFGQLYPGQLLVVGKSRHFLLNMQ